jgi:hypothetical protein
LERLKDDVSDIKTNVSVIPNLVSDQRTAKILTWLNTCDPSTNHAAARQKHEPTTGDWFIKSAAFTAWKSAQKSWLWLHGIPGAGKTVLCSTIIDHVKPLLRPETQFAYFYFDYNEGDSQRNVTFDDLSTLHCLWDRKAAYRRRRIVLPKQQRTSTAALEKSYQYIFYTTSIVRPNVPHSRCA